MGSQSALKASQLFELANVYSTTQDDSVFDFARLAKRQIQSLALSPGSIVVISLPSTPRILGLAEAIVSSDLVPAFVSPSLPLARLKGLLEDFHAAALIRKGFDAKSAADFGINNIIGAAGVSVGLRHNHAAMNNVHPGDIILVTSGTSSEFSSGCIHAIDALKRNAERHAVSFGLTEHDRVLVKLPLFYSFAFVAQSIAAAQIGARLFVGSTPFSIDEFIGEIEANGITVASLTPTLVHRLLESRTTDLPKSLRVLSVGGDRVPLDMALRLRSAYPSLELYFTYGISEAGPRVATLRAHEVPEALLTTLGEPLAGTALRMEEDAAEAGQGELLIKSDTLLRAKIGRNAVDPITIINGERWLKTGDIVMSVGEASFAITGRRSDFLISNGEKVNLAAIKSLCRQIKGVIDVRARTTRATEPNAPYALEIVIDQARAGTLNETSLGRELDQNLRRWELPSRLQVTAVDPTQYNFVK